MSRSSSIDQADSFPSWSELSVDILSVVAEKLNSIQDLYSCGGVCSSWRCIIVSILKHKNKTLPLLMLTANFDHNHRDFLCLAQNKTYTRNYPPRVLNYCRSWGSPFGWLVTFNYYLECFDLLNPFSPLSPRIFLPSLWRFPRFTCDDNYITFKVFKAVIVLLHSDKANLQESNHPKERFLVFVIYGLSKKNIAYCRPSDDSWTGVEFQDTTRRSLPSSSRAQVDIIHLNGQVYSVDSNGSIWLLCDAAAALAAADDDDDDVPLPLPPTAIPFASPPQIDKRLRTRCRNKTFSLLEMDAELHLAVRYQHPNTRKTALIEIFKLNASTREWQKLTTLGDYALFLGTGTSISVKAFDYPGTKYKPNFIYYCYNNSRIDGEIQPPDIGIIDVKRHENDVLSVDGNCTYDFSAPSWVAPRFL